MLPVVPSAAAAATAHLSEESEEEWLEVAAVDGAKADAETEDDFDIFGDAAGATASTRGVVIGGGGSGGGGGLEDMDDLERQINLQMSEESEEEEEDFLAEVVEEVPVHVAGGAGGAGPISLNEFAGGRAAGDYGSDDDYSSSESDEE